MTVTLIDGEPLSGAMVAWFIGLGSYVSFTIIRKNREKIEGSAPCYGLLCNPLPIGFSHDCFWIITATLVCVALLLVIPPLFRRTEVDVSERREQNIDIARERLAALEAEAAAGSIN